MRRTLDSYSQYKSICNKVRTFDTNRILIFCILKLHEISDKLGPEYKGYTPWHLLYLIKLVLMYGGEKYPSRQATINDIIAFINRIKNYDTGMYLLTGNRQEKLQKLMRALAFQQFWLQKPINNYEIARQIVLFQQIPNDDIFNKYFKKHTSLNIYDFLSLSLMSWGQLDTQKKITFDKNWFKPANQSFPQEMIDKYIGLISLNHSGAKEYLHTCSKKIRNPEFQIKEQSPLKKYPFLKIGNYYYCYSPMLFNEHIRNYIYDLLKEKEANNFTELFGSVFEKYIKNALSYTNLSFFTESDIKNKLHNSKVVDFIIHNKDCTVLIESKAIELSPLARVNPTNMILSSSLKDSIIKAMKQVFTIVNEIKKGDSIKVKNKKDIYAIVVTYKELYLGSCVEAWNEFIEKNISNYLISKNIDSDIIQKENIFFISVDGFDKLIQTLLNKRIKISDIFKKASIADKNIHTRKHVFDMYLEDYDMTDEKIPYLEKPTNELYASIESVLREHENESAT